MKNSGGILNRLWYLYSYVWYLVLFKKLHISKQPFFSVTSICQKVVQHFVFPEVTGVYRLF